MIVDLDPEAVKARWDRIRKNENCNLALTPESVAKYLRTSEAEVVRGRINESLSQFARYRIEMREKGFVSREPDAPGEMATCEGLEAFLIPAVEKVLPFSKFLEEFNKKDKKKSFVEYVKGDFLGLLEDWKEGRFSGRPYADEEKIFDSIPPTLQDQFKPINITEAAAMACRVLIHVLTLKLNRPEEKLFQQQIGKALDNEHLRTALQNAINYLIRAFQKGVGDTDEVQIPNATFGNKDLGSGWSWTDHPKLPPMLFFTAAAVDAFAELDLYLIRPGVNNEFAKIFDGRAVIDIYDENKEKLLQLQLCVEMARRWVQKAVLPNLAVGYGQHREEFSENVPRDKASGYDGISNDDEDLRGIQRLNLASPFVFYHSLYALLILLWSWGDWDDKGEYRDEEVKSRINRALSQLIYNYSSIPGVKQILNRLRYVFYLPGEEIFQPQPSQKDKCSYMDSAFLPLLMRLLLSFMVYGVGDRNLLEPVIRDLYVELMQNQNRKKLDYSSLWASEGIEVFATQRAIQALTFYHAFASGKEMIEKQKVDKEERIGEAFTVRNKTSIPLILELVPEHPRQPVITESTFEEYCKQHLKGWAGYDTTIDQKGSDLQRIAINFGKTILTEIKNGKINNSGAAKLILNGVGRIAGQTTLDGKLREVELKMLVEQHKELSSDSQMHGSAD